jgi:hypothetical protein
MSKWVVGIASLVLLSACGNESIGEDGQSEIEAEEMNGNNEAVDQGNNTEEREELDVSEIEEQSAGEIFEEMSEAISDAKSVEVQITSRETIGDIFYDYEMSHNISMDLVEQKGDLYIEGTEHTQGFEDYSDMYFDGVEGFGQSNQFEGWRREEVDPVLYQENLTQNLWYQLDEYEDLVMVEVDSNEILLTLEVTDENELENLSEHIRFNPLIDRMYMREITLRTPDTIRVSYMEDVTYLWEMVIDATTYLPKRLNREWDGELVRSGPSLEADFYQETTIEYEWNNPMTIEIPEEAYEAR